MKPWIRNNKIVVNAQGRPILCSECPCEAPFADCQICELPNSLIVDLSGWTLTTSFCNTLCQTLEGAQIEVDHGQGFPRGVLGGSACTWGAEIPVDCSNTNSYVIQAVLRLTGGGTQWTWTVEFINANNGSEVAVEMEYISAVLNQNQACNSWPLTLNYNSAKGGVISNCRFGAVFPFAPTTLVLDVP